MAGKVFVLDTEGVGKGDRDLGFEILMVFLEGLSRREELPRAILCWNTAVKLMAEGSPTVPLLRQLEEKGVKILAGKLCVADLGLQGKLAVGREASVDEIVDLLMEGEVVTL